MFLSLLTLLVALATLVLTSLVYRHLRTQPERRVVRPTWKPADVLAATGTPPSLDTPEESPEKWAPLQSEAAASRKQEEESRETTPSAGGDGTSDEPETPFRWNETMPPAASSEPELEQDDDEGFAWR